MNSLKQGGIEAKNECLRRIGASNMSNRNARPVGKFNPNADCTLRHAKSLAQSLADLIKAGGIEIDCAGVEQADITFVQTLVAAHRSCAARDLAFSMTGVSDAALSAFQRAGLTLPGTLPSELSGN